MKIKHWLILMMVLSMCIALTACDLLGTPSPNPTETTVSDDGTSAPDEETTDPDEETTDPDEETTVPDEGTTVPDEETTVPDEDTTVPDEETTVPDEETTVPDEETTVPDEEETLPHEHVWSDWSTVTSATCTVDGQQERSCICGEKETEILGATGHTEVVDVAVAPTCTATGLTEGKHCSVCDEVLVAQTTVAALGHTEVIDVAVAPTCTATGLTAGKHCSVCDEVLVAQTTVAALGHTEVVDVAVAPTCTATGLTAGKHCEVCDEVLVAQTIVAALGHTEVVDNAIAPTCTATGLTAGKHCSVCDEVLVAQTIVAALGHTEVVDAAVAPTCTATGLTAGKHCSVCDEVLVAQTTVAALGHTEVVDNAIAPTCTETGLTAGKHCSVCDEVLVAQTTVAALGHTEVVDAAIAPTCTATGLTEGKHCSVCDEVLVAQTTVAALGHTEVIDVAVAPTCTATGLTEGKHCSVCDEVLVAQTTVAALGHTEVVDAAVAPTCTATGLTAGKHCSVCGEVLVAQTIVAALGHTEVVDIAVAPTYTETGLTEGTHCSVCNTVLVEPQIIPAIGYYANPTLYEDDYGYQYLGTMTNGSAMQELYDLMDAVAVSFHSNATLNAEENIVGAFDFGALGLNADEAIKVWITYKNDHPLYYWISNFMTVYGTELWLLTEDLYANGEDRAEYNALIYSAIAEYVSEVIGETSSYRIALAFHDAIIYAIDYAYETDGVTPQDDIWAHNILGVFEKQSGVCESYARTFQLLLNCMEIENVFVTGEGGGEEHAWNLVQMDDGNWYWFDLTWDDRPRWMWGIRYNYFCVNDTQNVSWSDGGWSNSEASFLGTHTLHLPGGQGTEFLYGLPTRSASTYQADELLLRETFEVDGMRYAVVGYNDVAFIDTDLSGEVIIPESVIYNGIRYEVIAVGGMDGGLFDAFSSVCFSATSVTIPKTVRFIWDDAFCCSNLESISVAQDNPYFTSRDGVLFTKSFYTLIQYPMGNKRTSYTIPDEVVYIAYLSFNGKMNLEELTVGAGVEIVGKNNWGYGYYDKPLEGQGIVLDMAGYTSGGFVRLFNSLSGEKKLIISADNPNYYSDGIAIYGGNEIFCILDTTITTFVIPKTVQYIASVSTADSVFYKCLQLQSITVEVGNPWFSSYDGILYNKEMTEIICVPKNITGHITLPNTVTSIDDWTFDGCTSLTSVAIPDSVTSIGSSAFSNCTSLTSIEIPDSVTSIGDYAFRNCTSLTSVTIPDSVTSIGKYAFDRCTSLTSVVIGDSVTSIGNHAFDRCTSLTSVVIGDSVTSIGDYAFYGCTSLTSVVIGDSVTNIDFSAFLDCTSLTSVTIPDSVTSIAPYAFSGCTSLTSVYITDLEAWCNISFYDYDSNPMCNGAPLYLNNVLVTEIEIPDSVTTIKDYAFYNCKSLTSVTIPDSVTSIGKYAFDRCTSLTSVVIGDSVTSIGNHAFDRCTSLTSVVIGDSVTSIGDYAFCNCTSLTSITIPDSVTSIGNYAFYVCYKLVEVYNLSSSITVTKGSKDNGYVGYYALDVYTSKDAASKLWTDADGYQFYEEDDTCYLLGYTGTEAALTLPENCNGKPYAIYQYAFYNCESLTSVAIPDSVTSIGKYAFDRCTSLTSVVIGDSVTSIGDYAFCNCTSLTSITIPDSVTSIGKYAFYGCTSLTSVVIGDSVTSIGYGAFFDCTSLTSITIPDSVTSIGKYAFYGCTSLTSVVIGDSVTSIGNSAFYNCTSLDTVYYSGTASEWSEISIGSDNSYLTSATRYYYSETAPTTTGNYWHYVDGVPTVW